MHIAVCLSASPYVFFILQNGPIRWGMKKKLHICITAFKIRNNKEMQTIYFRKVQRELTRSERAMEV